MSLNRWELIVLVIIPLVVGVLFGIATILEPTSRGVEAYTDFGDDPDPRLEMDLKISDVFWGVVASVFAGSLLFLIELVFYILCKVLWKRLLKIVVGCLY